MITAQSGAAMPAGRKGGAGEGSWRNSEDNMAVKFDREAENLGNITMLEHLNVEIPNQALASNFYLVGCGFTRDPHLFSGTYNMWFNIGRSQFHLPTGDALVFRGHVGIITPSREQL